MSVAPGGLARRVRGLAPIVAIALAAAGCGEPDDAASAIRAAETVDSRPASAAAAPASAVAEPVSAVGDGPMTLSITVGGQTHAASGTGECRHADPASIYDMASSMWTARYRGEGPIERLHLTVWRPKSGGPDQLGLRLRTASGEHEIDTVAGDGETSGSATATIEPDGEGGRLAVEGRDADGVPIRAIVECARFGGVDAVGG